MHEIYPTNWERTFDVSDPRNEFHVRALREARIATDFRQPAAATPTRVPLVTRFRLALAGGAVPPIAEPCNCPA